MREGDGRSAHSVLMDKVYRRQRHFYDLTRKYYLLGRDRLVRQLNAKPGERVIEIGCGTARNLIRIAETYPGTELFGLDASAEMLHTAHEAVARARLSHRIVLKHALAEELTPSLFGFEQKFDHAIFSYSLSMIPDWRAAIRAAGKAVRPDGFIHVVDFGDLRSLWPVASAALRAWLRLFHVAPRDELVTLLEERTQTCPGCALYLLPGRYAFVFKSIPAAVVDMATSGPRL
jgi:S-adenosylmethionine-diacylgycerolhomoserine-N-methlytransferase